MLISCFNSVADVQPSGTINIETFLGAIKKGRWKNIVCKFRELNEEEQDKAKKKLPCVTISGRFAHRSFKGIDIYSKLICVDVDDSRSNYK